MIRVVKSVIDMTFILVVEVNNTRNTKIIYCILVDLNYPDRICHSQNEKAVKRYFVIAKVMSSVRIPLEYTDGKFALVSAEDAPLVKSQKWCRFPDGEIMCYCEGKLWPKYFINRYVPIGRFIAEMIIGPVDDTIANYTVRHLDNDKRNCLRENLMIEAPKEEENDIDKWFEAAFPRCDLGGPYFRVA